MSREERERLKQEYKEHYRQLLEQKKKLAAYERKARIMKSLEAIDPSPVLHSFQNALQTVREKITLAESRLETWMDHQQGEEAAPPPPDAEEVIRKEQAGQLVRQIRAEMGVIERDLEDTASGMKSEKTVYSQHLSEKKRSGDQDTESDPARTDSDAPKTIGRKKS